MEKIDLRRELKHLYAPSAKKVEVVKVPKFNFVMVDGRIEPGASPSTSAAFHNAMEAVYGVAYTLKFMSKLRPKNPIDYGVMALEGLWWVDSGQFEFGSPEPWNFTLMVLQPKHITQTMVRQAVQRVSEKHDSPALAGLRLAGFAEGLCIQIMHLGPYAEEPRTVERMKAFARENGYVARGKHHEIYLGDPRRAKPEKVRTILRQPVARAG
jgi:hypothetical protein